MKKKLLSIKKWSMKSEEAVRSRFVKALCAGLILCGAMGWWGVLYPQLTMTPDTYRVVSEDGTVQNSSDVIEWDFDDTIYMEILNAGSSRIRFRSKLLENAAGYLERFRKE